MPPPSATDVDLDLPEYLQTLTPLQRIELHQRASGLVDAVREAGRKFFADRQPGPASKAR